jgi:hypothetical protein
MCVFSQYFFRHAREGGHPVITNVSDLTISACVYWIPAFAGMTVINVASTCVTSGLKPQ